MKDKLCANLIQNIFYVSFIFLVITNKVRVFIELVEELGGVYFNSLRGSI